MKLFLRPTRSSAMCRFGALFVATAAAPFAPAEELPQVEVHCGVVFSLVAAPTYASWQTLVPQRMGSAEWNRVICLHYAPFVIVKNNTGWPLTLNSGPRHIQPVVTFIQPPLQLQFQRLGDSHAGFATLSPALLSDMYSVSQAGVPKSYRMVLYDQSPQPTSFKTLSPGEICIFTPHTPPNATFKELLDWRNELTQDLQATVGWKGPSNGFCADYLVGREQVNGAVNADLPIVPTRSQDAWDVRISGIEAAMATGTRVFRHTQPHGSNWPIALDPETEIARSPYDITSHRPPISAATMSITMADPAKHWLVEPIFSVTIPPATLSGIATDANLNGMNDEWEKHYFGNVRANPRADDDGDGYSNYFEYLAGTSPLDATDFIRQSLVETESGNLCLEWSSVPNRTYVVETSFDLESWTPQPPLTADSATASHPLDRPQAGTLFARIRIVPPVQTIR